MSQTMIGRTISHYRVVEKLGGGGMGVVYKAEDIMLQRDVALKFLPPELSGDKQALERFLREARAAAALNHPNICMIHEIGEHEGQRFIAMELLYGETLQERIVAGPTDMNTLLTLGSELADALDAFHARGIVHRDIKPANVYITERHQAKVLDFGLVKHVPQSKAAARMEATTKDDPQLTSPGVTVGTVAYMSPEQVRGEELDARTDLFSLGVVLYEMATGRQAFSGPTPGVIFDAILNRTPIPSVHLNPRLPAGFEAILNKALEKDRTLRYQSAADLRTDLQRLRRDTAPRPGAAVLTARSPVAGSTKSQHKPSTGKNPKTIDSLAVLPLENMSGDPDAEYLSDGIAETLINTLAQLRKIRVVPRTLSFRYRGSSGDPLEAGRELGVRAVLSGRMMLRSDDLVVSVELVDVDRQAQLWGARFSRKMTDLVALLEELATEISAKLRLQLSREEKRKLQTHPTQSDQAYRLILMAQHYLATSSSAEGIRTAVALCRQAIDIDPAYAAAHARLAIAYSFLRFFGHAEMSDVAPGLMAARKALELDDALADAHISMAWNLLYHGWDLPGAEREMQRALGLSPDSADGFTLLGIIRLSQGRVDEAVAAGERAVALAPFYGLASFCSGVIYLQGGRVESAIKQLRASLEIDSADANPHAVLAGAYAAAGQRENAVEECEAALALGRGRNFIRLQVAAAYAALGETGKARTILDEIEKRWTPDGISSFWIALVHSAFGDRDAALEWLERAFQERAAFMVLMKQTTPLSRILQGDPRFESLARRVGIPD